MGNVGRTYRYENVASNFVQYHLKPVSVTVHSNAQVSSGSIARIVGSYSAEGMDIRPMYLLCVVWVATFATS